MGSRLGVSRGDFFDCVGWTFGVASRRGRTWEAVLQTSKNHAGILRRAIFGPMSIVGL